MNPNTPKHKTFLPEAKPVLSDFNQTPFVKPALRWLKNKFPFKEYGFTFEHRPKLANPTKTYQVHEKGKSFDIAGRKMDTTGDDNPNVIVFKIINVDEQDVKKETF